MKVRVVLMTENDKPASNLGENPEEVVKRGWELLVSLLNAKGETKEKMFLEKVEIVE